MAKSSRSRSRSQGRAQRQSRSRSRSQGRNQQKSRKRQRSRNQQRSSQQKKRRTKRALNPFMKQLNQARKNNSAQFQYNGKTYKRGVLSTGMVVYKL